MKQIVLFERHIALGAKMVPFAGFEMPVWFSSLQEEHNAVRTSVGMFDISHMGVLSLTGPTVVAAFQRLFCNRLQAPEASKMVYGFIGIRLKKYMKNQIFSRNKILQQLMKALVQ